MIDPTAEELWTPAEYARRMPGRGGRPMNVSTFYRHVFTGCKGIKLEHVRVGGHLYTSAEAVRRFAAALTARDADRAGAPPPQAVATIDPAADRRANLVESRLVAAGL